MMKLAFTICALMLSAEIICAQHLDSVSMSPPLDSTSIHQGRYIGRLKPLTNDSVVMSVNGQQITMHPGAGSNAPMNLFSSSNYGSFENQVSRAELEERDALVKRDTAALRRLWQMDYTAGNTQSRKLTNRGLPIPYYESFNRIVERVTIRDGLAYANGVDIVSTSDKAGRAAKSTSYKFVHVWKLFGTQWKMISRFPNDY